MVVLRRFWLSGGAVLLAVLSAGCAVEATSKASVVAVAVAEPKNFHRVDAAIWRSGQPERDEFQALAAAGLKSVLNLRHYHRDRKLVADLPLALYELQLDAGSITREQLLAALKIIHRAEKPILIHCRHGSDRTGAVVAACRIVFDNWSVEAATEELLDPRFGHHRLVYPNIPRLLRSIDWEEMRREVNR